MTKRPANVMGCLITFEGVNGSGKTTVMRKVADKLIRIYLSHRVHCFNCPGSGIPKIRDIFKDPNNKFSGLTDLFLICADQAELFKKVIPLLTYIGNIVLIDRLIDSTIAYQAVYGGISNETIEICSTLAIQNKQPDLTFIFDVSYEVSEQRRKKEVFRDRFEKDFEEKFNELRESYINIASYDPSRVRLLDGEEPIEKVVDSCFDEIISLLGKKWHI